MTRRAALTLAPLLLAAACTASDQQLEQVAPPSSITIPDLPIVDEERIPVERQIPGLIPDLEASPLRPVAGVWFRLYLRTTGGPVDQLSLTSDGRLVAVADTSVFAGPADVVQYQLSMRGLRRAVELVETTAVVSHDGSCCLAAPPGLADALLDPSFLDEFASPPEPWIPETLTVYVQPPDIAAAGRVGPPIPWPLATGLLTDIDGTTDLPYMPDAPFRCLTGDDAAAVWALLGNGRNTAWLPVDDGTGPYLLRVDVQWPGYRLYGDPCG